MSKKNRFNYASKYSEPSDDIFEEDISSDIELEEEDLVVEDQPSKIVKVKIPEGHKLNIREDTSIESVSLGALSNGKEVELIDDEDPEWFKVVTPSGIEGYILKEYCELV